VVALLSFFTLFCVNLRLTDQWTSLELYASIGLIAFNYLLAIAMLKRKSPTFLGGALGFGLFLIATKLFVNTFTILLLIGLQAVRTPVFVPLFFAGYFVLLASTIWALHRTSFE
jgi:hypothetical protein